MVADPIAEKVLHLRHNALFAQIPEDELRISRDRILKLQEQDVVARFDFNADTAEMNEIRALYPLEGGPGRATATAAQLLLTDLSAAVTTRVRGGYDTHGAQWAADQVVQWYGEKRDQEEHFAYGIDAGFAVRPGYRWTTPRSSAASRGCGRCSRPTAAGAPSTWTTPAGSARSFPSATSAR